MLLSGGWQVLFLFLTAIAGVISGLLVFIQGFLLTRHALLSNSTCSDFGIQEGPDCWLPRTFNRTVVLLIDGLHYDFAAFDPEHHGKDVPHHLNKMPVFQEIIEHTEKNNRQKLQGCTDCGEWRGAAFLTRFIADAPTTTMQRLKALVTGGLPTFIDVAHNFDSPQIMEDSLIWQLEKHHRNVTVLGDDTWHSLFPHSFHRSFLFPSFNVRDLHTVDDGILRHLDAELERSDTQLLVAHFLGVDHAGHRYGRQHPRMADKLTQMDGVVRRVARTIRADTLLVVMGDHGMTASGDHGGDSPDEVTAALFVYSPGLARHHGDEATAGHWPAAAPAAVQQVAVVPTLALLLGVPVPYSSVGAVVPSLFGGRKQQLAALDVNVRQVHRFLLHYAENAPKNVFPRSMWSKLQKMILDIEESKSKEINGSGSHSSSEVIENIEAETEVQFKLKRNMYEEYLMVAKTMCEEIWATFNVNEMVGGITLMIITVINLMVNILSINKQEETRIYFLKGNFILFVSIICTVLLKSSLPWPVLCYIPSLFSGVVVVFHVSKVSSLSLYAAYKDCIPIILVLLICLGNFSNSFVVSEDTVMAFSLASLFVYQTLRLLLIHKTKTFEKGKVRNFDSISNLSGVVSIVICLVSCSALRWSQNFYRCREEQPTCLNTTSHLPLSSMDPAQQSSRFFTGLTTLIALGYLPRYWLSVCGNLNGPRVAVLAGRYASVLCAMCVAAYWALEAVPRPTALITAYTNYAPRAVFITAALAGLVLFIKPLMIFRLERNNRRSIQSSDPDEIIAEVFHKLKAEYGRGGQAGNSDGPPVVYGLATALSAPLLTVAAALVLVLVALLGDGMAPSVVLVIVVMVGWCVLHALACWHSPMLDSVMRLRWMNPVVWFVLSLHCFYALGHQATFPTIPWSAAFVGFIDSTGGSSGTVIPMVLVSLHTFAGHLLMGFLLPLLVVSPLTLAVMFPSLRKNRNGDELRRGEFILADRPEVFLASVATNCLAYAALHSTKVLFSCVASLLLRRHLMVWKVFAPHLVFQAVGLLVTVASLTLGMLFAFRVLGALHYWATDITLLKVKPT